MVSLCHSRLHGHDGGFSTGRMCGPAEPGHNSHVARDHTKKLRARAIAEPGARCVSRSCPSMLRLPLRTLNTLNGVEPITEYVLQRIRLHFRLRLQQLPRQLSARSENQWHRRYHPWLAQPILPQEFVPETGLRFRALIREHRENDSYP